MAHILKLTVRMQRGDESLSWGFRMAGGVDYNMPLSVQKVMPGTMAEEVGLLPGDLITAVGDPPQPALHWSHAQSQNAIRCCGNYLVMTVQRGGGGGNSQLSSPVPITYNQQQQYQSPQRMVMPPHAFSGGAQHHYQQQHQQQQQQPDYRQTTTTSTSSYTRSMLNDAANQIRQALSPSGGGYSGGIGSATSSPAPFYGGGGGGGGSNYGASPQPPPKPTGQQAFINVQYENGIPIGVQSDLRTRQNPHLLTGSPYDGHNRVARPFGAPTAGRPNNFM